MQPRVTKHADKRIRKRVGVPKKATQRLAKLAWEKGITHAQTKGRVHKYLDMLALERNKKFVWRLFGNQLFAFQKDGTLMTVYPLPGNLTAHKLDVEVED